MIIVIFRPVNYPMPTLMSHGEAAPAVLIFTAKCVINKGRALFHWNLADIIGLAVIGINSAIFESYKAKDGSIIAQINKVKLKAEKLFGKQVDIDRTRGTNEVAVESRQKIG